MFPCYALVQNQRKVAAHRLEAGDLPRDGLAQRQLVEAVEIELADEYRLLELAGRGLARMQLAKPADGCALDDDPRRAVGMEPRGREAGLGGKAVEVDGARLEARQHLLDDALDIVKIDGPRRVERSLLGQAAHGAKGKLRGARPPFPLCR